MTSRREVYNDILARYTKQRRARCPECERVFGISNTPGRKPVFCSNACKQSNYRKLKAENDTFVVF